MASRFWPAGHRRFEEMCTLAVTAQLGGAQMCELNEHIATCASCRKVLESLAQVSLQAMPLLIDKRAPIPQAVPPSGIRERFLARLASETNGTENGTALRPFPMPGVNAHPISPDRDAVKIGAQRKPSSLRISKALFSSPLWRPFIVATGCVIVTVAAYYAGTRRTMQPPPQVTQAHPVVSTAPPAPQIAPKPIDSDLLSQLERQKKELEGELARLKERLSNADGERQSLRDELAAAKEKLAAVTTQAQSASQSSLLEGKEAKNQVATLQSQVDRLNQRLAASDVKLDVQKQTSEELSAKLETTTADLRRELDVKSAKSELGDVVAARNLHIVDVYDADPSGKRQRSFGRVFYIEGKSLVFYAYDLDDPRRFKANVVFHVWGGKAGIKEVTHSLGILHKDDAGQNRWAMTFDDPNVLAQINSVFVTAESATKHYDEPHGKKVLYAYFGSPPNHP